MHDRRRWPTLAILSDGVYVAGGSNSSNTVPGSANVLASVERLPWSELGITGPIDFDAGVTDGAAPDAAPADTATDTDVPQPSDASADAELHDASSSDRLPSETPKGCSCAIATTNGSFGNVGIALLALVVAFSRHSKDRTRAAGLSSARSINPAA
jgi:hypothetical protein